MSDLVEFLRARLDEDERIARDEQERRAGLHLTGVLVLDFDEFGPYRMLAEIEAKQRMLDLHSGMHCCAGGAPDYGDEDPCPTLRLLALPYADHPDYREEWRP